MKSWLIGLAASGLLVFGASGALAAEVALNKPTPHAVDLAQRYFKALNMEQSLKPMLEMMMGAMIENQLNANPDLTPLQRGAMLDASKDVMADGLVIRMMNRMAPGFAQVLSERELEAMVGFYESPEGRSVISKMGALQKVGERVGQEMAPEVAADVLKRACQKIECPKT